MRLTVVVVLCEVVVDGDVLDQLAVVVIPQRQTLLQRPTATQNLVTLKPLKNVMQREEKGVLCTTVQQIILC